MNTNTRASGPVVSQQTELESIESDQSGAAGGRVSDSRSYLIQIISPVYNEGDSVFQLYDNLCLQSEVKFDTLTFIYDFEGDNTLPFIAELSKRDPRVRAEKNEFGKGVVHALKWGLSRAKPGPLIVVMSDNSDKLSIIPDLIKLWESGVFVAVPSRYMTGGKQHGGPLLKKFLSGTSGRILKLLGFPTSDPTNNYKLYDGAWVSKQQIESTGGFEVALELTGKAFFSGLSIKEIPTEWWDRTQGESNFKMWAWIPLYLKWYVPLVLKTPFLKITRLIFSKGSSH